MLATPSEEVREDGDESVEKEDSSSTITDIQVTVSEE